MNLPPLPEPSFRLRWSGGQGRYTVSKPNIDSQDCYSAEAVRAYAAEAVRVALEAAARQCEGLTGRSYEFDMGRLHSAASIRALIPKD